VEAARRLGADVVISVDISAAVDGAAPKGAVETILKSVDIMYAKIAAVQIKGADIVIRPRVGTIGSGDFSKRHEAVLEGERAAVEALPALQAILDRLRAEGRLPASS
jgi:NTE family protein